MHVLINGSVHKPATGMIEQAMGQSDLTFLLHIQHLKSKCHRPPTQPGLILNLLIYCLCAVRLRAPPALLLRQIET